MSRLRCALRPIAALALASTAIACAGGASGAIHDWTMRERVALVQPGQDRAQARAILGDEPVRRPGHPEDPFPTPREALSLTTAEGGIARIEIYVVATRRATGCPDVHYEDVPVAYLDDVVVGTGWPLAERRWREWGGSLEALRGVQNRHRCPYPKDS